MNAGLIEFLLYAALLIAAGFLVLRGLVAELAPEQRRRWLLGVALGTGVVAFTLKVAFVVVFSSFSDPMLALVPNTSDVQDHERKALASLNQFHTADNTPHVWQALPTVAPVPADNPQTPSKIALGKQLFFDKRLSLDGTLSCASCHGLTEQEAGADGRSVSVGIYQQEGNRNAPTVLNSAFQRVLFWDGRASSLEEQALGPLINPVEMGMPSLQAVEQRIQSLPEYAMRFATAFPENPVISADNTAKAIAAYERTLITPNSPYDRFVRGDHTALTAQQQRGMALFAESGCPLCHSGPNFSEASVYGTTGVYRAFPSIPGSSLVDKYALTDDLGLAAHSKEGLDIKRGVWRVPSLRNVARTAPYFHNGSVDSLKEAVKIMATVQLGKHLSNAKDADRDVQWQPETGAYITQRNLALSDTEIDEIVAFLEALSSDT